jgi:hypothetical protein
MTRQEIAAIIIDDLRKEALEAHRLERIDHDHDFTPMVRTIIDDLTTLAERFSTLMQDLTPQESGMYTFRVYYEQADGNEPARLLGTIQGDYAGQALDRAAQRYEYPQHDLVVKQIIEQPGELRISADPDYQPLAGDVYILQLWFDQYTIKRYDGARWQVVETLFTSDGDVTKFVKGMRYLGDSRNQRQYYRPQPAESEE